MKPHKDTAWTNARFIIGLPFFIFAGFVAGTSEAARKVNEAFDKFVYWDWE